MIRPLQAGWKPWNQWSVRYGDAHLHSEQAPAVMHTWTCIPSSLETQTKDCDFKTAWVKGEDHDSKENKKMSVAQEQCLEHKFHDLADYIINICKYKINKYK